MSQIFNSDKPITAKDQDRFNRSSFSYRIAETILKRKDDGGIVIGLYGIWGEGKTSILNMIEEKLMEDDEALIINFNPWRFKDEDTLILHFFRNISEALNQELNTKKEKFGTFLKKYGSVTSVFNLDLTKIGETLSDNQLENLKNRVNDFLAESRKKIVVIIDDIDRLDRQELFSLFKLIKLTGDFSKTYYILSFDDQMVASAIGERFAEGNIKSGYNFLEKIIQVPLRIPRALSKNLLEYVLELLNNVLKETNVDLQAKEGQLIGAIISQNILIRIKTPRLAIRYANSLSFLIPLLKGEVNISDLILFEGLKIFYPNHYDFVKSSPEYFIESYHEVYSGKKDTDKVEEFNNKITELNENLSKNEKKAVLNLLKELFPYIKEALAAYHYGPARDSEWTKQKRIASPKYFDRYFIYSVPNDDISDIYFDNYISHLSQKTPQEIIQETDEILSKIDSQEYLNKIGFCENELDWGSKKAIIELICKLEDKFEGVKGGIFMVGLDNPKTQAAMTISRLLIGHNNYAERLEFSKTLMSEEIPFEFSREIIRWLQVGTTENEKVIKPSDLPVLNNIILERALKDCDLHGTNIFQKYDTHIFSLLRIWHDKDSDELKDYIDELLESNPKFVEEIIDSMTSIIYSSARPDPYKTDFQKESFILLQKCYDVEKLNSIIRKEFSPDIEKKKVKFYDNEEGQTKLNALKQFLHWYDSKP